MADVKILIVEDESIVAMDIKHRAEGLGYSVTGITPSGEGAIKKASETVPDLILMDIVLKGDMDGIETAQKIRDTLDIPVVYLTAYSDEKTLNRAKVTEPFGFIIKPFEDRELHSAVEVALYKHKMESKLKESEKWLENSYITVKKQAAEMLAVNVVLKAEIKERKKAEKAIRKSEEKYRNIVEKFLKISNEILIEISKKD